MELVLNSAKAIGCGTLFLLSQGEDIGMELVLNSAKAIGCGTLFLLSQGEYRWIVIDPPKTSEIRRSRKKYGSYV
ncbi:hypothetical protein AAC387_Pa06g1790 [Persea americana]